MPDVARKRSQALSAVEGDRQFHHINDLLYARVERDRPTVSVDTKKKELLCDFANRGREWRPGGHPAEVRTRDFVDRTLGPFDSAQGEAIPYGVYDVVQNRGFVNVGIDHDTPAFAAHSILRRWARSGRRRFPGAADLLITADGGGSNSSRSRLWKVALQRLSDDLGLVLVVRHS